MKERKNYIDAVKGISMLCIVVGHSGIGWVSKFVFTFHVPIFLIISGLFFKPQDGIVKKRFDQMVRPYLSTAVVLYLLGCLKILFKLIMHMTVETDFGTLTKKAILEVLYGSGSRTDFFNYELPAIGAIWFFWAVIWATAILFYTEKKISERHKIVRPVIIVILFLIAWLTAFFTWFPLSIQAGMSSALFLYLGYLGKKYDILNHRIRIYWVIVALVLWLISLYYSYTNELMSVVRSSFPNVIINVLGAVSASFVIIVLVRKFENIEWIANCRAYRLLCFWGKNSGIILCCHLIEMRTVNWHLIGDYGKIAMILVFILKISIISFGTLFITKNEKLRSFF